MDGMVGSNLRERGQGGSVAEMQQICHTHVDRKYTTDPAVLLREWSWCLTALVATLEMAAGDNTRYDVGGGEGVEGDENGRCRVVGGVEEEG